MFDAPAVLAFLQGEPGADRLNDLQPDAVVNAVNAAEVLVKLVSRGMPAAEAQAAYEALHLETTPFEPAADNDLGVLFGSRIPPLFSGDVMCAERGNATAGSRDVRAAVLRFR